MTVYGKDYHKGEAVAAVEPDERRECARFPTRLRALYYMSDAHEGLEKCEVFNVSYGGLGIRLNAAEAVKQRASINLGIVVQWHFMPISLQGTVKWVGGADEQRVCGVEFAAPLDNITLLKLM